MLFDGHHSQCCESDSKLEKLRFLETANSRPEWCCSGPELTLVFFQPGTREKSAPELSHQHISETYFLGQICSDFMGDTFTINIDFVSE